MVLNRVATGKEALRRVGDSDVVLPDLGLPDMNVFELCRAIGSRSDGAIVIFSARAAVSDGVRGLK